MFSATPNTARSAAELLPQVEAALGYYSWEGVSRPSVLGGTIGSDARAIGSALLPLYANFALDNDLFLKSDKQARSQRCRQ